MNDPHQDRRVCRRCHRPEMVCLCRHLEGIPPLDNRTGIIILQHPRERFHPLGTARLALQGLGNARLEQASVDASRSLRRELSLPPGTGLLYPHPDSTTLIEGGVSEPPQNLLLLDGTWHNARKLYQANPWLQELPHYQLQPDAPGRYRIRREPDERYLSTIEAVVQVLKILEPETAGLDRLLQAFDEMIDAQVEFIRTSAAGPRYRKLRPRRRPISLIHRAYDRLVLTYAELIPSANGGQQPLYWVAQRPSTGETFERMLKASSRPPDPQHLTHMLLSNSDMEGCIDLHRFKAEWNSFVGKHAVVTAWNQGVLDHVARLTASPHQTLLLKATYCNLEHQTSGGLDTVIEREGLTPVGTPFRGRAGQRLGQALAVLQHLRQRLPSGVSA